MGMSKLRSGDEIIVITGKNKGRRGTVQRVLPNDRVIVDGVNVVKRHRKPNPQMNIPGGIVEEERPIHRSNIMLFNQQAEKGERIGFKVLEDGRKVRIFKGTREVVDAT